MIDYLQSLSATGTAAVHAAPGFPLHRMSSWLDNLVHSAQDGVIVADGDGCIVLVNASAARLFGQQADFLLGRPAFILLPERQRAEHHGHLLNLTRAKVSGRRLRIEIDLTCVRADGSEFLAGASISRLCIDGRTYIALTMREVSDAAAEAPMPPRPVLRRLALSSQQANETERRRFSKELYDDLGQRLSVLKLDLDWLQACDAANPNTPHRIAQMQRLLDSIISRTRSIASTLRPSLLDDFGLLPAVEWMADEFEKRTQIGCDVVDRGMPARLGSHVESAVYRLLQESLANIERHSQASHCSIELWHTDRHLHVLIRDNGIGISEESRSKSGCNGLNAMQERIYTLGGHLVIRNNVNGGVEIRASIPISLKGASFP